jgi:hypothetical protein
MTPEKKRRGKPARHCDEIDVSSRETRLHENRLGGPPRESPTARLTIVPCLVLQGHGTIIDHQAGAGIQTVGDS